jgi:hypothetical protein
MYHCIIFRREVMGNTINFVRNYSDHSNDRGFQFEFYCDRCGSGTRTRFEGTVTGAVSGILDTASSLFGGFLGSAATVGDRVKSASWQRSHDDAFEKAVKEVTPEFIQCPRCSTWVCRKSCWNTKKGLCKNCAPDLGVEMAAAQASKSVEEVWAHAAMAEEDKKLGEEEWRKGVRATCPKCEAPLSNNVKFCPECGEKIQSAHCTNCGTKLVEGAKFCGDCGQKVV